MMSEQYKHLFSPIRVGSVIINNRIALKPMGVFSPQIKGRDGAYTKDGAEYYIERAKGGAGLIITGLIPIVANPFFHILADPRSFTKSIKYLFDGVHHYGSKIFVQLSTQNGWVSTANEIPAPAAVHNVRTPRNMHTGMNVDEIKRYIKNFAEGAYLVQQAGGDGVEIHAVHVGYLLDQFSIPSANLRSYENGRALDNRLHFSVEIVQAIKAKCGKCFPVSMRYSVRNYMKGLDCGTLPGEKSNELSWAMDESRVVACKLQDAGYDMLNAENSINESWYWSQPHAYMPITCNLDDVAEIKNAVDIPVICSGCFDDLEVADAAIAEGRIDMLGIGQPLLADPEIPRKYNLGDLDEIRPCISCNQGCFGRIFQMKDISYALNPSCGRETRYELKKSRNPKKVLVIGGGLSGMEAARVCAIRGHEVHLYERTDELGGVFITACAPSFKDDDMRLLAWYKKKMKDLNIDVTVGMEVTKKVVDEGAYDEIFVATGANGHELDTPGLLGKNVSYAISALRNADVKGNNIVIIGSGLTGCELAYIYGVNGKKVTLIEKEGTILNTFGLSAANYYMLMELMERYKVNIMKNTVVEKFERGVITVIENVKNTTNNADWARHAIALGLDGLPKKHEIPADHVVISAGAICNDKLYTELRADNVHLIGGAKHPANAMDAIWDAYETARTV